jgi:hypothetical protein
VNSCREAEFETLTVGDVDGLVELPGRVIEAGPLDALCLFQLDLDLGAHEYVPALLRDDLAKQKWDALHSPTGVSSEYGQIRAAGLKRPLCLHFTSTRRRVNTYFIPQTLAVMRLLLPERLVSKKESE